MAIIDKLTNLKKSIRFLREEKAKAEGALSENMRRLKKEFDCHTITEADKLLSKAKIETEKTRKRALKALADFENKWKDSLE